MKKITTSVVFTYIVCLYATTQTHAQMRDTTANMNMYKVDANSLFQKTKKQKTAAWIMLGGGAGLITASLLTANPSSVTFNNFQAKSEAFGILLIAGGTAMVGSIPFFVASGKNKRKAELMLKDKTVLFNPQLNIKEHFVSLGINISF